MRRSTPVDMRRRLKIEANGKKGGQEEEKPHPQTEYVISGCMHLHERENTHTSNFID